MTVKSRGNYPILWGLIVVLLLIAVFLPIKIPHRVGFKGKLYPAKEWMLIKGPDGRLMTSLINFKKGVNENYSVAQFERGDAVEFSLRSEIYSGHSISVNDTIGSIYSNESEIELVDLRSSLASESALLKMNLSTEKEAVVKSEQQRLEYAKKQLEEQQKLFTRQNALYEKNLISEEEYDVAKGAVDLFRINVDIAVERLRTVTTGAKEEEIDYIKSRIDGLKQQIDILERKFSDFVVQSPISGTIKRGFAGDTLVIVSDTTEYLAFMPIYLGDIKYVRTGMKVYIESAYLENEIEGNVVSIDKTVQTLNQAQYIIVIAQIKNPPSSSLSGIIVSGSIECEPRLTRDYLSNLFNAMLY